MHSRLHPNYAPPEIEVDVGWDGVPVGTPMEKWHGVLSDIRDGKYKPAEVAILQYITHHKESTYLPLPIFAPPPLSLSPYLFL
jgi:hypothetical protein